MKKEGRVEKKGEVVAAANAEFAAILPAVEQWHAMAIRHSRIAIWCAACCGHELLIRKKEIGHGGWMKFLKVLPFSDDTARRYMDLAVEWKTRTGQIPHTVRNLPCPLLPLDRQVHVAPGSVIGKRQDFQELHPSTVPDLLLPYQQLMPATRRTPDRYPRVLYRKLMPPLHRRQNPRELCPCRLDQFPLLRHIHPPCWTFILAAQNSLKVRPDLPEGTTRSSRTITLHCGRIAASGSRFAEIASRLPSSMQYRICRSLKPVARAASEGVQVGFFGSWKIPAVVVPA
jgi:hypothetical protein